MTTPPDATRPEVDGIAETVLDAFPSIGYATRLGLKKRITAALSTYGAQQHAAGPSAHEVWNTALTKAAECIVPDGNPVLAIERINGLLVTDNEELSGLFPALAQGGAK